MRIGDFEVVEPAPELEDAIAIAMLIRFALYGQVNLLSLAVVAGCTLLFMGLAIYGYDPGRGMMARRRGAPA